MNERLTKMTVEYSRIQDRLRFRLTSAEDVEYQFWLTRRIVGLTWPGLIAALEKGLGAESQSSQARKAMLSMHHQDAVESGAFSRSKRKRKADDAPIPLATAVRIGNRENHAVRITFITEEKKEYGLNLPEESVHALCHLIRSAVGKAGWSLDLHVGDDALLARPPTGNVH